MDLAYDFLIAQAARGNAAGGVAPKQDVVSRLLSNPASLVLDRQAQLEANARATAERVQRAMNKGPSAFTKEAEFMASLPNVYDAAAQLRATVGVVDNTKVCAEGVIVVVVASFVPF